MIKILMNKSYNLQQKLIKLNIALYNNHWPVSMPFSSRFIYYNSSEHEKVCWLVMFHVVHANYNYFYHTTDQ